MFSNISFHHSHQTLRQCISRWAQNSLLSWSFHCALIDHMDHSSWNQGNKSLAGAGTYIRLHAIGHPKTWQGGWNTPALKFSDPPKANNHFLGGRIQFFGWNKQKVGSLKSWYQAAHLRTGFNGLVERFGWNIQFAAVRSCFTNK